jgi:hypothetical protein
MKSANENARTVQCVFFPANSRLDPESPPFNRLPNTASPSALCDASVRETDIVRRRVIQIDILHELRVRDRVRLQIIGRLCELAALEQVSERSTDQCLYRNANDPEIDQRSRMLSTATPLATTS